MDQELVYSKGEHHFKTQAVVLLAKGLRGLISCTQVGPLAWPRGREREESSETSLRCNAGRALHCEWSSGAYCVASRKPCLSPNGDADHCLSLRVVCHWEKNV